MTPSSLCCSLELAKKLKALGVKKKSYFYWCEHYNYEQPVRKGSLVWDIYTFDGDDEVNPNIPAYTTGELGEIMPLQVHGSSWKNRLHRFGEQTEWTAGFEGGETCFYASTEADARAKMLIHLIENGLLKIE